MSLDFSAAFDNISHTCLQEMLRAHGFSNWFSERIMGLYTKASSEIQISGFRSSLIPLHSSIGRAVLSARGSSFCVSPPYTKLWRQAFEELRSGGIRTRYADDVTVFLTSPAEAQKLEEILDIYETATCARVNRQKSRALALGNWDMKTQILDITYQTDVKILRFQFTNKVNVAANENCTAVTSRVLAIAKDACQREFSLDRRIHFVHAYMLARLWYIVQIFPPPAESIRQLNTSMSWFIWRREIFRIPLFTLQRGRTDGGLDLINVLAKCRALFIHRMQAHGQRHGSFTAA